MFKILSLTTALALGSLALATAAEARGGGSHGGHGGPSMSHPGLGGGPMVVRDHRMPVVVRDHRTPVVVRDHRTPVVVRDHRGPFGAPQGGVIVTGGTGRGVMVRDHRSSGFPGGIRF